MASTFTMISSKNSNDDITVAMKQKPWLLPVIVTTSVAIIVVIAILVACAIKLIKNCDEYGPVDLADGSTARIEQAGILNKFMKIFCSCFLHERQPEQATG